MGLISRIINFKNFGTSIDNSISSRRNSEIVENRVFNWGNDGSDITNNIYNIAKKIRATNQVINIYQYPTFNMPYTPSYPSCYYYNYPPWNCYGSRWPGYWGGYYFPYPPIWNPFLLPFFVMWL